MDALRKLEILADAAKYDVSCSSSGSNRQNKKGGLGNASAAGICHSWTDDGRCISLLKILMSNSCIYDCAYCVNRSSNDLPRATFTPEEVADITINFYKRNYIEGLFLSSAVVKSPDHTMEQFIEILKKLRDVENFNGYIHLKAIPGADKKLLDKAGSYADRMSVNIELPTEDGLRMLAPQKKQNEILGPMNDIKQGMLQSIEERKIFRNSPKFVPAGQTTQLIVGATKDSDYRILKLSEGLYNDFQLKRVYYSAFVPVSTNPLLPRISSPPLVRENRLYQADWLLRFYGFNSDELLSEDKPDFDLLLDPKCDWALRNIDKFPIEINRAEYHMLLRVPGIGVKSAQRIVSSRRFCQLDFDDLKKLGVVLKRAKYFITCKGIHSGIKSMEPVNIRANILGDSSKKDPRQLSLFDLEGGMGNDLNIELPV
ncbi:putative DNA modification/repair radical SAM protein [Gudongella oleilytica]|jgi:putative DNA modification/repair radical SAM protein|uniref:putative DNA modification/repair radical SAM protein n=1 Tax=Gudongella oleilytica TaxID=1582259 RepID=UPI002A36024B|nr:putative DNA modification/repair radical SAM protein [Gudongella oleilytica]MDY0257321.1 putative DNA modification/repair radical SAM protein [Gudongella oleilytica]HMM68890.1 putative DNA modification/repair radical SAM protein [Gudongella oleilytica]